MVNSKLISLSEGPNLVVELLNAREVRVNPMIDECEKKNGEDIIEIDYKGLKYKVGDLLDFNKYKFKIRVITKEVDGYHLHFHVINKSSMFIMPMLASGRMNRTSFKWADNFCNCFIGTQSDADYGDYIYLLYRFDGAKSFETFEKLIQGHPWFVAQTDPDNYHVLYKFEPDENFKKDYNSLVDGKYSAISEELKKQILFFHATPKGRPIEQILYKDPARRKKLEEDLELNKSIPEDVELYDKFKVEEEIYLDDYIINLKTNEF